MREEGREGGTLGGYLPLHCALLAARPSPRVIFPIVHLL